MTNITINDLKQHLNLIHYQRNNGLISDIEAKSYVQGMRKMLILLGLLDQEAAEIFYDFDMEVLEWTE